MRTTKAQLQLSYRIKDLDTVLVCKSVRYYYNLKITQTNKPLISRKTIHIPAFTKQ